MKSKIVAISLFFLPVLSQADVPVFTGDVKLACEAVLCLSSGTRPSECAPALSRYFGINKKFWSDTVNARKNFCMKKRESKSAAVGERKKIVGMKRTIA